MTQARDVLRRAALGGAGQAELLGRALGLGLFPYDAPAAIADALHVADLRRAVLEFAAIAPDSARGKSLRASIRTSAAAAEGADREKNPARLELAIESALEIAAGDLNGWRWLRNELIEQAEPARDQGIVADCLACFRSDPAVSSSDLAARLRAGGGWSGISAKLLAGELAPYGIEPRRLRIPGCTPGTRGYLRDDFRRVQTGKQEVPRQFL